MHPMAKTIHYFHCGGNTVAPFSSVGASSSRLTCSSRYSTAAPPLAASQTALALTLVLDRPAVAHPAEAEALATQR